MRSVSVIHIAFVAGIALAVVSPSIAFSQAGEPTTEDLTRRADIVVVGKVTEVRSEWTPDRSRIFSTVTVSVQQHIKGDASESSLNISTPGGEVEGVGEVYSHMPRFKMDEHVIVFAARDQRGELRVVGGDDGKLTVMKDEVTGLMMVSDREPVGAFALRVKRIVQAQRNEE